MSWAHDQISQILRIDGEPAEAEDNGEAEDEDEDETEDEESDDADTGSD